MTVSVREVGAAEVERLSRLTVDAFAGLPGAVYEDGYLAELADVARRADEAVVLVAVDDENGDVLGGITYVDRSGRWSSGDLDGEVELRMLAVAAAAQGRGVAGRLVDACITRAAPPAPVASSCTPRSGWRPPSGSTSGPASAGPRRTTSS